MAYNAKEQQATILSSIRKISFKSIFDCPIQVEAELGTMREQLSSVTHLAWAKRVHCQLFAEGNRPASLVKCKVNLMDNGERGISRM